MQSGKRISEIWSQFGFLNYSSFYRAFRKEYGCSPGTWLEEHLSAAGPRPQPGKTALPE
jgi:AraC-like DNA-binding protein